ncbi:MAG: DEAD/DEAH box helicase [Bacteroidota bacterium]|nr:DEAD/DEAH box helicase [Bacteroidota bacterium]
MKFEQYRIAEGIKTSISKLGYKKPTDIQFKSIPPILKGEDVLAISQTGTGKTAAFAIPVLHILQERKIVGRPDGVKCLVMAPTHELALQIDSVFKTLGKHTRVSSFCIHGGVDQEPQIKQLNKGVDILIATPGRMFDLVSQGALNLKRVEILVLDEADHMLDLGFVKDIHDLMRHIPKKRQTLFFSATINEKIKKLAYSLVTNPIRIQISPKDPVARNIEHAVAFIEMDDKRFFLEAMIKDNSEKKILIFVRTKIRAERVKKALERVEIIADSIHSDKLQEERTLTMDSFRKGELKVLVATDVSARGIDIQNVEFVVNYDLPETLENYVHRVGRTGRGSQKGQAVSFCSSQEKELLDIIEKNLGKAIQRMDISKKDYKYTLENTENKSHDWRSLLEEEETRRSKGSGGRRKKKRKSKS